MSVEYTATSRRSRSGALWNLGHAKTVDDGFRALADFTYGSQTGR